MKYRVYLRDWYYNAGIVGFLNVLSEGNRNIEEVKQSFSNTLNVEENYLEFDSTILKNFFEKYRKLAFDLFFDIDSYKERIKRLISELNEISQSNRKITKQVIKETGLDGKIVNNFIKTIYGRELNEIFSKDNVASTLLEVRGIESILNNLKSNLDVYDYLVNQNKIDFIRNLLHKEVTKGVCSYEKINEYIELIEKNNLITRKYDRKCYICGQLKKEYEFSNAISQIIGFNSDNLNWVWGFHPSKVKICALCALIYVCAIHGMVFIRRKVDRDYLTFFYFLNQNTDIATLYNSFWIFKEKINQKENQDKPFYTLLQEVTLELINRHTQAVIENINFVEIKQNQFGGQSTKAYNVYNYNVTKELAEFIQTLGGAGAIPKGFYKDRDFYSDVREELLKKTLNQTLSFSDLSRYFEYFIRALDSQSKIKVGFSISKVNDYVLKYIYKVTKGGEMSQNDVVNKAFHNGVILGKKIGQENKIKTIAYQLLNDLKISDRNSFLDKYLRLTMAYNSEVKLGSNNELTDMDNFMSFGYAFVNGLLSNIKEEVKND